MDTAQVVTLLLTGGVGLWVAQVILRAVQQWLRSRGRIRSEKDALVIARSQWIERYSKLRNAAVRGDELPPWDVGDEYDDWLSEHRSPPIID